MRANRYMAFGIMALLLAGCSPVPSKGRLTGVWRRTHYEVNGKKERVSKYTRTDLVFLSDGSFRWTSVSPRFNTPIGQLRPSISSHTMEFTGQYTATDTDITLVLSPVPKGEDIEVAGHLGLDEHTGHKATWSYSIKGSSLTLALPSGERVHHFTLEEGDQSSSNKRMHRTR